MKYFICICVMMYNCFATNTQTRLLLQFHETPRNLEQVDFKEKEIGAESVETEICSERSNGKTVSKTHCRVGERKILCKWDGTECVKKGCSDYGRNECPRNPEDDLKLSKKAFSYESDRTWWDIHDCSWHTFSKRGFHPQCLHKCSIITDKETCSELGHCDWYGLKGEPSGPKEREAKKQGAWKKKCRDSVCGNVSNYRTCRSLENENGKRLCYWKKNKCRAKKRAIQHWKSEMKKEAHGVALRPSIHVKKHVCEYKDNPDVFVGKKECETDLGATCEWLKSESECLIKCNLLSASRCKKRDDCTRKYKSRHQVCQRRRPCSKLKRTSCKNRNDCKYISSSEKCREA